MTYLELLPTNQLTASKLAKKLKITKATASTIFQLISSFAYLPTGQRIALLHPTKEILDTLSSLELQIVYTDLFTVSVVVPKNI